MTTRRQFLTTLFIAGLMTQLGLRGADVGKRIRERPAITSIWLRHDAWSSDRGQTWRPGIAPEGVGVERWYSCNDPLYYLEQKDPRKMPTLTGENCVNFDGKAELTNRCVPNHFPVRFGVMRPEFGAPFPSINYTGPQTATLFE